MAWNPKTGRWELDTSISGLTPQQKALMDTYNTGSTESYRSAIAESGLSGSSPVSKVGGWSGEDFTAMPGGLAASTLGEDASGKGLFGQAADWLGNKNNQMLVNTGLGLGQLGLGLASYLQQSDFMNKQGKLLDQQLASNQYEIDRRKGFSRDLGDPNGAFATSYNAVRNA